MAALETGLRRQLESAVIEARRVAERAADAAIDALAVEEPNSFPSMNDEQRRLRTALRARAKQLGEGDRQAGFKPLVEEIAYEQWHQMLFARFLAENNLLMHPAGVPVTLDECEELAADEGEPDGWAVAAKYAARMLPGIFRVGDPSGQVNFAPESRGRLEALLTDLPTSVFTASDSLGWVYQFWQTDKKKEVNASGRKIGGADLPPVTQLFTENYMVRFLLENSLGAWWAGKHPESPLLREFVYLRFKDDGTPAAGTFPGWPETVAEVTVMDPCCGSGHFLVEAFDMLTKMRMEEEGLDAQSSGDAVLRDNLFGLEIDPRCTQIAAFAVAFAAWKTGGYREIPVPNIGCSGIPVKGQIEEWKRLADGGVRLEGALTQLYQLYGMAPHLGSLIDPEMLQSRDRMFTAEYDEVEPLVRRVLDLEAADDPTAAVLGNSIAGVANAAFLLTRRYTLVLTNVPYLQIGKFDDVLRNHALEHFPDSKENLATIFVARIRQLVSLNGSFSIVCPQNWHFLTRYARFRNRFLKEQTTNLIARLGSGAFGSISGEVVSASLLIATRREPRERDLVVGIDVISSPGAAEKEEGLLGAPLLLANQRDMSLNVDSVITFNDIRGLRMLSDYAIGLAGVLNGDSARFECLFWEVLDIGRRWEPEQSTVKRSQHFGGRQKVLLWEQGNGQLRQYAASVRARLHDADRRGNQAWGKQGVAVSQMGELPVTLYSGDKFDTNVAVLLPKNPRELPAIWAFCSSPAYSRAVRQIDQALKVTNASLAKVPFDLDHWQKVADEQYPDGLPEPYSNDPTQWLFKGRPDDATEPLQVAVARLLGYQWPEQDPDELDRLADDDGIVTLQAVGGERPAAERLRDMLAAAFGDSWSPARLDELLEGVGYAGKGLDAWLMDGFFPQHCKLFHNRPFIWHIWDGRKDGFSALVNYHKLDGSRLERLIYTYLGNWIGLQRAERDQGIAGADGRLVAALQLQEKLELIRTGEKGYDIYVRWKPLHEQPIGWNPDLNDGVRLNIRPWIEPWGKPANSPLRSKFTVHWKKDRGKDPDGSERHNDKHLTLAEKREARERAGVS